MIISGLGNMDRRYRGSCPYEFEGIAKMGPWGPTGNVMDRV